MNVLFLLPYPQGRAPSQRFRVEMLLPLLDREGISYKLCPFMTEETWNLLYRKGRVTGKIRGILKGYLLRIRVLLKDARKFDFIFIHREAAPLGPPVFEWYLAKVLGKPIIYDFDDAVWINNTSAENRLSALLKSSWKVGCICRWSAVIAAGNSYLCAFARQHSRARIVQMPTVVDTVNRYNRLKEHRPGKITVGWTGSHSTLKYIHALVPVLRELQQELDFTFLIIADKRPMLDLKEWAYIPWQAGTEIDDLLKIDIGLMPLEPDEWAEGKCGFKIIQYLALGIPALSGPTGANEAIIEDGINGYICRNPGDWYRHLGILIRDDALRRRMGRSGSRKIRNQYSIASNSDNFLRLFS